MRSDPHRPRGGHRTHLFAREHLHALDETPPGFAFQVVDAHNGRVVAGKNTSITKSVAFWEASAAEVATL
jgi:hypothetical protein